MYLKVICLIFIFVRVDSGDIVDLAPAQEFYWKDFFPYPVPPDAVEAKPGLFIGQAIHGNGIIPVVIYPYQRVAAAMDGIEIVLHKGVKILCASDPEIFYWERVNFMKDSLEQLENAVEVGFQDEYKLYVGAFWHGNTWKIGKVRSVSDGADRGLYVWDDMGHEVRILKFELFKVNTTNAIKVPVIWSGKFKKQ